MQSMQYTGILMLLSVQMYEYSYKLTCNLHDVRVQRTYTAVSGVLIQYTSTDY